jgi:hypothetical protein
MRVAMILLAAFLLGARSFLRRRRSAGEELVDPGSSWSEDLAEDRRFERSLIPRELAVILLIGFLVAVRQLLS